VRCGLQVLATTPRFRIAAGTYLISLTKAQQRFVMQMDYVPQQQTAGRKTKTCR
jgi:hypothetical protein